MKKLYGFYGGSRMYGFPLTEKSDWDYYSVGLSSKVSIHRIYPNIKLHQKKRSENLDVEKVELASFITYLMNGLVFQIESLFVHKSWMDYLDPRFKELVLDKKHLFIDRCALLENVGSNIEMVRKKTPADIAKLKAQVLASNPSRKIVAGISRMNDEYQRKGYYHRDYLHNIRIAASVLYFMKHDIYPLDNLSKCDPTTFDLCCAIKENPDSYCRGALDEALDFYLRQLEKINLDGDEEKFRFDGGYAQNVIATLYS